MLIENPNTMKIQKFTMNHSENTKAFARKLALILNAGDIIGLEGELGTGKTTFVQGMAQGLRIREGYLVSSPTYTFIHEYPCHQIMLYHMDFYRLGSCGEVESLGLDHYLGEDPTRGEGICVIEWFGKARLALPKDILEIKFSYVPTSSQTSRQIEVISHGPRSEALKNSLMFF